MNKRQKTRVYMYVRAQHSDIYSLYKKPSDEKVSIFRRLYDMVPSDRKYSIRVWGNCFYFTFAYMPDNKTIRFITPNMQEDICL